MEVSERNQASASQGFYGFWFSVQTAALLWCYSFVAPLWLSGLVAVCVSAAICKWYEWCVDAPYKLFRGPPPWMGTWKSSVMPNEYYGSISAITTKNGLRVVFTFLGPGKHPVTGGTTRTVNIWNPAFVSALNPTATSWSLTPWWHAAHMTCRKSQTFKGFECTYRAAGILRLLETDHGTFTLYPRSSSMYCDKCEGLGHVAADCPRKPPIQGSDAPAASQGVNPASSPSAAAIAH